MINKQIGVIFGGRSGEHEVSLVSARSIMKALSPAKYNIVPIGITKEGRWVTGEHALDALTSGVGIDALPQCLLSPDPHKRALLTIYSDGRLEETPIDVLFPVLHGTYGEDGAIQGLFEISDIPYIGSDVLGSALCMNKVYQKRMFNEAGIPQVEYKAYHSHDYKRDTTRILDTIQMLLDFPVFVKPACSGSSVGISMARNLSELIAGIETAIQFDHMFLVEGAVPEPRELEIAVLGNEDVIVSPPGEIIPSGEFYDYNAKYVDGSSRLIIPAVVPVALKDRLSEMALRAYKTMHCEGLARVDFLYSQKTGDLYVNEINTMPGFTSISMYPKLFEAAGIQYPDLLDRLVRLAIHRHALRTQLTRTYSHQSQWYKG